MPQALLFLLLLGVLAGCTNSVRPPATTVRIRWARDPESLDPLAQTNQQATDAVNLLHLGLLQFDYQTGQHAPALAQELPTRQLVGDSLTRLDYHLRPQAAWDDGHPVLATDVAFTLKLLNCPGLPNEVGRAEASFVLDCLPDSTDPRHFWLLCQGQSPDLPRLSGDFPVLPEAALDANHSLRTYSLRQLRTGRSSAITAALAARYQRANVARHPEQLPGCGAYRLLRWQTNRVLVFGRKPYWWADRLHPAPFVLQARPARLQYIIVPDATAAVLALRRRELDVLPQLPARAFQQLQTSTDSAGLAFYTTPSHDVLTIGFNTQLSALRDKRTRQALSLLLDPQALLQATQGGQGQLTASLLPPGSVYYNDSLRPFTLDPTRAEALLRQAHWQRQLDGSWQQPGQPAPLRLLLRYRADDNLFATVGLQWRAAAARLGIPIDLRPVEGTVFTQTLQAGDFGAYVRILKGSPFAYDFRPLLASGAIGQGNFPRFANARADQLLTVIHTTQDQRQRRRLLWRLQALIQNEVPLLPLFMLPNRLVADYRLHGVTPSSQKPGYAAPAMSWRPVAPHPAPLAAARP